MKNHLRIGFALSLLTCLGVMKAECPCEGSCSSNSTTGCSGDYGTILVPRPLDARLNWQNHYFSYQYDNDCIYGKFGINYEYMRSMKGDRIAKYLFGTDKLSFLGSKATRTRTSCDLLADNFGLATDLDASIRFEPRIQNHIFDFQLYVGLNELCNGLYFQINLPLVHSKWELNDDCNCNCNSSTTSTVKTINSTLSTTPYPAGYMSSDSTVTDIANLATVTPNSTFFKALTGVALGDMTTAWTNGKFFGHDDDTKLASVNFDLGYNFYECEDYHVGVFARVSAPTGTELDEDHAHYLFKPVIGEHHWKLGGGLDAHAQLYNCDDAHIVEMYLSGYAVHLFEREQVRSFDIKNAGRLSRYMLLKSFNTDGTYAGKLYNAIDYTTRRTNVKVSVEGEGVVGFTYKNECGFGAGVGYNIYGKAEEKICGLCKPCNNAIATKNLGIKGVTPLQAQEYQTALGIVISSKLNAVTANAPLINSTQSGATAYVATAAVDNALALGWITNGGTPKDAFLDYYNNPVANIVIGTTAIADAPAAITSSKSGPITQISDAGVIAPVLTYSPVYLTDSNLDLCSAEVPSQITHRIFGHLDYEWDCDWTPALRLGGEVEFASESDRGAVNQWGILLQGSVTF